MPALEIGKGPEEHGSNTTKGYGFKMLPNDGVRNVIFVHIFRPVDDPA